MFNFVIVVDMLSLEFIQKDKRTNNTSCEEYWRNKHVWPRIKKNQRGHKDFYIIRK